MNRRRAILLSVAAAALLLSGAALTLAQSDLTGRFEIIGLIVWDHEQGVERLARFDDPATPTPSATPSATLTNTPAPSATPAFACEGVTLANLRLRRDSSLTGETITILDQGTRVTVEERRVYEAGYNAWAFVEVGSFRGWAAEYWGGAHLLELSGPCDFTPAPSATPGPTETPAPSSTPGGLPEPTQEAGLPTVTPGYPWACELKSVVPIRFRSRPDTGGAIVGGWALGDVHTPNSFRTAGGLLWARFGDSKWAAIYEYATRDWWAKSFENERHLCMALPGWDATLTLPAMAAAPEPPQGVGWTFVMGIPLDTVIRAGDEIKAAGYTPAATLAGNVHYGGTLIDRGWIVNARPWYNLGIGDHPDLSLSPENSARARVQALEGYTNSLAYTVVQLTNETVWPSADYLNRWIVQAVKECNARSWACMPVVFSTGTPELNWWPSLRPALEAMRSGGHWLGYNAYPYQRDLMLCDQNHLYTTWRIRLVRQAAGVALPPVWVTEAARGAGDVAPILSDNLCFAERAFEAGDYDVINFWFVGQAQAWQLAAWAESMITDFAQAFRARFG